MKQTRMLIHAALKKQKAGVIGAFLLMLLIALSLFSSLTLLTSGGQTIDSEMARLGFGDFTVWVSDQPDTLEGELKALPDVGSVTVQPLIFSGYKIAGRYSDNEGQLIVYDGVVPYQFITADGKAAQTPVIEQGTVYLSPAMRSTYDVDIGDNVQFELTRTGGIVNLQVAGYFADAFMGSSMIDMKGFLISAADRADMLSLLESTRENDRLGRSGAMLHITKSQDSSLKDAAFSTLVQTETSLPLYTEFTYRRASIASYMLLLQNVFAGFLMAFSVVLLVVCLLITAHSLSDVIGQDSRDIAILKTMGLSGGQLRSVYLLLFGGALLLGALLGMIPSLSVASLLASAMVTSTGLLVEVRFPTGAAAMLLVGLGIMLAGFLLLRTRRILRIAPVKTMQESGGSKRVKSPLRAKALALSIAFRELLAGKRKYIALSSIAMVLTLFLSLIGRMGAWLGSHGEGLMNAFSVAEHDLGVQPLSADAPMDEIERAIRWYSPIVRTYELAMQSVTVNGQEYTANVLDDTAWFHLLQGAVCDANSILITDTVASELSLRIGDTAMVAANGRMERYTVSGIYQCANGMGSNIGMSRAGYSKLGDITGYIWCRHYILEDGSMRDYAMQFLQEHYRGIDVHTNSWSGLDGIVTVMHIMIGVIYLLSSVFILITVILMAGSLIRAESGNMAIYKSLGMHQRTLRLSFALRFLLCALGGAVFGSGLAALCGDRLIAGLFRSFGIGDFSGGFSTLGTVMPLCAVPLLFLLFAWLFSAKLSQVSIVTLVQENDD